NAAKPGRAVQIDAALAVRGGPVIAHDVDLGARHDPALDRCVARVQSKVIADGWSLLEAAIDEEVGLLHRGRRGVSKGTHQAECHQTHHQRFHRTLSWGRLSAVYPGNARGGYGKAPLLQSVTLHQRERIGRGEGDKGVARNQLPSLDVLIPR